MIEVQTNLVKDWTKTQHNKPRVPIFIKVDCPSCGTSLVGFKLEFTQMSYNEVYHARANCMACRKPAHLFMVNWTPQDDPDNLKARIFIDPSPKPNVYLPTNVDYQTFSPRFVEVYRQAAEAEVMGFNELAGMGYRKALEMLLVDYLIAEQPDNQDAILRETLGNRIEKFIENPQLQRAARHAAWLGNDETHYDRRHPDADLDDLKTFLHLTLDWISMEVKAKSLDEAAAARKKAKVAK